jgi:endonuclease/exonuclease/phosphatase family metal-dependent hydrolase
MTYNILQGNNMESDPLNNWENRKDDLVAFISAQNVDLLGVQEALYFQLQYLNLTLTGRNYSWVGDGRVNGVLEGEFAAIFYDQDLFSLLQNGTFWLSATPDIPSRHPSETYRICSWAHFQIKSSGKEFFIFNTHYGFSPDFQIRASQLINRRVVQFSANLPVIVMGDFNMLNIYPFYLFMEDVQPKPLYDAYRLTHGYVNPLEATNTLTWDIHWDLGFHIDHFFVSNHIQVQNCTILKESYDNRHTFSDHYPVLMKCCL